MRRAVTMWMGGMAEERHLLVVEAGKVAEGQGAAGAKLHHRPEAHRRLIVPPQLLQAHAHARVRVRVPRPQPHCLLRPHRNRMR